MNLTLTHPSSSTQIEVTPEHAAKYFVAGWVAKKSTTTEESDNDNDD